MLLFTIIPAIELYLLITVGSIVGAPITILIIILTGVLGAYLAKTQGLLTMRSAMEELRNGKTPTEGLVHGILIVVAGIVLITPGFFTDIVGFLLLIPTTRKVMFSFVKSKLTNIAATKYNSSNTIEISPNQED